MSVSQRKWVYNDKESAAWQVFVRGTRPDGVEIFHRRVLRGITKPQAVQEEARVRDAIRTGTYKTDEELAAEAAKNKKPPTLSEFWADFVAGYTGRKGRANKPSEWDRKRDAWTNHIEPFFGHMRIDEIRRKQVDAYVTKKRAVEWTPGKKYSPKTINNELCVLSAILRTAVKWEVIPSMPDFEWLAVGDQDFDFLTFEEADQLLAVTEEPWRTLFFVAMRTGLRPSEIRALRWEHVDFANAQIHVKVAEYNGRTGTPKDGDPRDIDLSPDTVAVLKAHRARLVGPPFVFVMPPENSRFRKRPGGGSIKGGHTMGRALDRATKAAKLRPLSMYVFRHTFASHCIMRGVAVKQVSDWMGHGGVEITNRYLHLAPKFSKSAAALLDGPPTKPEVIAKA